MSADTSLPLRGSCECGACSFEVHTSPKARFRCHCLICQAFNGKPFADVVAVRAKDVVLKNAGNISFKKYRPPLNFNRGACRTCGWVVKWRVDPFGKARTDCSPSPGVPADARG